MATPTGPIEGIDLVPHGSCKVEVVNVFSLQCQRVPLTEAIVCQIGYNCLPRRIGIARNCNAVFIGGRRH